MTLFFPAIFSRIIERIKIMGVGDRMEMLIHEVREWPVIKRSFALDR